MSQTSLSFLHWSAALGFACSARKRLARLEGISRTLDEVPLSSVRWSGGESFSFSEMFVMLREMTTAMVMAIMKIIFIIFMVREDGEEEEEGDNGFFIFIFWVFFLGGNER